MTILGIIPARGGSKALPGKHLMTLNHVSLIGRALASAAASTLLTRVVVSTDSAEIAAEAKRHGGVVITRPAELATDEIGMVPVLQHAVRAAGGPVPDLVVCLQPTSPFRTDARIDETIWKVLDTGAESAQTVRLVSYSPYFMSYLDGDRTRPFILDGDRYVRRQDAPPIYQPTGAVYVTRYRTLMDGQVLGAHNRAVICDFEESVNIDTLWDFRLAELIAAGLK